MSLIVNISYRNSLSGGLGSGHTDFVEQQGQVIRCAAERGDVATVRLLLAGNSQISNAHLGLAMERALGKGHVTIVELLLATGRIPDEYLEMAMRCSAGHGYLEIVRLLLEKNQISGECLGYAMNWAIEFGRVDIVKLLLATGRISDEHLGNAMNWAISSGHLDIMRLFLENGRISDEHLGNAITQAARFGHLDIVQWLLATGRISDEHLELALRCAVGSGRVAMVRRLLEIGRISGEHLGNAIAQAARFGHLDIVRLLLATGRISDGHLGNAIEIAAVRNYLAIVQLLLGDGRNLRRHLEVEIFSWFQLFDHFFPNEDPQIPETSKRDKFDGVISKLIDSLNDDEKLLLLNYLRNDPNTPYATSLRSTAEFQADGQSQTSLVLRVIRMIFLASEEKSFRGSMLACIDNGRAACGDRIILTFNDIEVEWNLCCCRKLGEQEFAEMAVRAQRYELVKQKSKELAQQVRNEHEEVETILYLTIYLRDCLNLPISTKYMNHSVCAHMNDALVDRVKTELGAIQKIDLLAQSEPWRQYLKTQYPSAEEAFEWVETTYADQEDLLDSRMKDSKYKAALKSIIADRERDLFMLTKEWTMQLQKERGLLLNY
jgi:ankyrin repeat protein